MTDYTKKSSANSTSSVQKKQMGIIYIEATRSNPNGNASDGRPRQLPDELGEISPVCVKSKMRQMIRDKDSLSFLATMEKLGIPESDFDRFRIMESKHRGFGHDVSATEAVKRLGNMSAEEISKQFWDCRMFGATQLQNSDDAGDAENAEETEKKSKKDKEKSLNFKRTGCVSMTSLLSVEKIHIIDSGILKTYPPSLKHTKTDTSTFGSMSVVQHALYVGRYVYSPIFAEGVTEDDLKLFKFLMLESFGMIVSASRASASVLKVVNVTFNDCFGNDREFGRFYNAMIPKKKQGIEIPNSIMDYEFASVSEAAKLFSNATVEEIG